jgi:hypothetical protein
MTPPEMNWAAILDWFCRDFSAVSAIIPEALVLETTAIPAINRRTIAPTIKGTFTDNFMLCFSLYQII